MEELGLHGLYDRCAELSPRTTEFLRSFDGVVSFLGGSGEIVSQRLAEASKCEVFAIDPRPSPQSDLHIVSQWVEQLHRYSLSAEAPSGNELEIHDRRAFREQLRSRLEATKERTVLCHPGGGGLKKCCPHEVFERIVTELQAKDYSVAWMIGPDEMERFGVEYRRRLERIAPVLYEESVEVAADWVAGADAFIGNDAGMTHVAALCGVETIALFGPTNPTIWRPLGRDCSVVSYSSDRSIAHLVRDIINHL